MIINTPLNRSHTTSADVIVQHLVALGVRHVFGVAGDALNGFNDAMRRADDAPQWVGVRHEEVGAFAAAAQAQLEPGTLGVCAGTVGPGALHLVNGLADAMRSGAPVLALTGQVNRTEMGTQYHQEIDLHRAFEAVSLYQHTVTVPEQLPRILQQATQIALGRQGPVVVSVPADVMTAELSLPAEPPACHVAPPVRPDDASLAGAVEILDQVENITLLVGRGAATDRAAVIRLADRLSAPVVASLRAKDLLEPDNPSYIGQSGLLGNPAAHHALHSADAIVMLGTDFPYRNWLPSGIPVIQVDTDPSALGRRIPVTVGLVGDAALTAGALARLVAPQTGTAHLNKAVTQYHRWMQAQAKVAADEGLVAKALDLATNRKHMIRPEQVAAAINRHLAPDAVVIPDVGLSTVWAARFLQMRQGQRLIGSFNHASMANAMPQAIGAQLLDRDRQVVAMCGDGGLSMLLGDLRTLVTYDLPVKLIVFDNHRLGLVKVEQESGGIAEVAVELDNPDFAAVARAMGLEGVRVQDPTDVDDAIAAALASDGPVLVDVLTNPDEISVPPAPTLDQAAGFFLAKTDEFLESR